MTFPEHLDQIYCTYLGYRTPKGYTTVDAFDRYEHRPAKGGYAASKYLDLCSNSHLIINVP